MWELRETFVTGATLRRFGFSAVVAAGVTLAGCAETAVDGDPGPIPLAAGQNCGSIQQELNRLLGRGVQGSVERDAAGKKLTPAAKADVDRYNALLNQYLGARCHV
jgi:hypothetical protein